ncbi:MAG: type I restriction enzyme HsdR N-terminal domain-containing protein [Trichlorobacter sp.]|uniref:type I restriction enzyme HsdR N-terminal domain-containing protein n=1 Tax=Trichlorobacter sp. TaxID=2911007 RepID=UPI00256D8EBF|nr:type I restriction enzyme HsdR N-terminal domain-containing protein [Trichlorobacter sp.]MDK9717053.1 type I restriction enzyme HsdR N-terminal domain-containing protein [Trichlorobacter sp.]
MQPSEKAIRVAETLKNELLSTQTGTKKLKVKTLLNKFGLTRRTEKNTTDIAELLGSYDILTNPSIMKLGNTWELSYEDWIYLSVAAGTPKTSSPLVNDSNVMPDSWNSDGWFDAVKTKNFRTEKEVETKFIIPLLARLGYSEDDRYDAMPVTAANGSRQTILEIDFAVFNNEVESLKNQVLLTVEAKREDKFKKPTELVKAKNQAKSYALWTGCSYCLVTDGKTIVVSELARSHVQNDRQLFCCTKEELKERFQELFNLISKDVLTSYYISKVGNTEEIR